MTELQVKERIIGTYGGGADGPTVICIAGIHGNEPAGVQALTEVLNKLEEGNIPFKGRLVGIAGNLCALGMGVRFVDCDLNRIWRPSDVEELLSGSASEDSGDTEHAERRGLIDALTQFCADPDSPVCFLDLHTTSSSGSPFMTISDTLRNRRFASVYPVPKVLGIEERLDSTLLNYINELGYIAVGFEAGRHEDPSSVDNSEAALWITLSRAGCISASDVPEINAAAKLLESASGGLKGFFEVLYRYGIENEDGFIMEPGFKNFDRIKKGQLLAKSSVREIRSTQRGRIFMPLYQAQGTDGFFVVRQINPFWISVSSYLRKLGISSILPVLPGIEARGENSQTLVVDDKIAKWYVIEVLHLLGYRRMTREGGKLTVRKRRFDAHEPPGYDLMKKK